MFSFVIDLIKVFQKNSTVEFFWNMLGMIYNIRESFFYIFMCKVVKKLFTKLYCYSKIYT